MAISPLRRQALQVAGLLAFTGLAARVASAQAGATPPRDVVVVLDSGEARITLIDRATRRTIGSFPAGKEPHHLLATPDNELLVVAAAVGGELLFLDPVSGRSQGTLPHIEDPYQIGFSPDKRWFVANCLRLNRVDFYRYGGGRDLTLARRLGLGEMPSHMAFTADSRIVFVSLQQSDEIAAIELATQRLLWTMKIGSAPAGVWLTPADAFLLVALTGSNRVVVVDWRDRRAIREIVTGEAAHNFRSAADGRHVLVSNRISRSISMIDLAALTNAGDIEGLRPGPDDMELSSDRRWLWTTFRFARSVGVIDMSSRRLVDVVEVGNSPHGIYFYDRAPYYDNLSAQAQAHPPRRV